MCGHRCFYFCADDTHGTPIMISARAAHITPEQLIEQVHREHTADFDRFYVQFDNYYTTHSPENREFSELIFDRLNQAGSIVRREVEQTYCEKDQMPLPDRYVRGTCPRCGATDQYGDSCEVCGATYRTTDWSTSLPSAGRRRSFSSRAPTSSNCPTTSGRCGT
jgi:methionyl-tRNA synthetase